MPYKDPERRKAYYKARAAYRKEKQQNDSHFIPIDSKISASYRGYTLGQCINCGLATPSPGSLYCGERCGQIAQLIRYARRKLAEGTYDRPDIAEAIRIRGGILVAGGYYDKRSRAVTEETRENLRVRSKGRCEKCGCEFTSEGERRFTVQHTATKYGFVLEAWCYRCNMDHVLATARPIESMDEFLFIVDFENRIHAKKPRIICDDPDEWPNIYREMQMAARAQGKAKCCVNNSDNVLCSIRPTPPETPPDHP